LAKTLANLEFEFGHFSEIQLSPAPAKFLAGFAIFRDVVLEAAVSAGGRLEAFFQPVLPRLCLGDPAALAWLGLELSASVSARSHDFLAWLGLIIFASALSLFLKSCLSLDVRLSDRTK